MLTVFVYVIPSRSHAFGCIHSTCSLYSGACTLQSHRLSKRREATLNALTAVTEQEARIRWAEAATLQSAFVYRGNSSLKEPSAAEAVLAMLCHHARTLRGGLCRQGRFVQDPAGAYRSVTPDTCPPPQVTETERREATHHSPH